MGSSTGFDLKMYMYPPLLLVNPGNQIFTLAIDPKLCTELSLVGMLPLLLVPPRVVSTHSFIWVRDSHPVTVLLAAAKGEPRGLVKA